MAFNSFAHAHASVAALGLALAAPVAAHGACSEPPPGTAVSTPAFTVAATDTAHFRIRLGAGEYLAGRAKGAHAGADIVATGSSGDPALFRVFASGGGVVAFAKDSDPKGYGYTIIIDHENGEYSLYSHFAETASASCVAVGERVHQGQVIGYAYDPATDEASSGNARATKPWERVQIHVELIRAPAGRRSTTTSAPIKSGSTIADPTLRLDNNGYRR